MTKRRKAARTRLMVGVMSGTSVDGIDAALVEITNKNNGRYAARVLGHVECQWPGKLRERLLGVMAPARAGTAEICELNFLVAREFAGAVERLLKLTGVEREEIAGIGSHGQTVCHLPGGRGNAKRETRNAKSQMENLKLETRNSKPGSTLQLGDVSVIATLMGIVTVGDFRAADMAAGGQGAPLVPWADAMMLSDERVTRCVQNIGGIGNVTWLPRGNAKRETRNSKQGDLQIAEEIGRGVIAFDTGPGNMVMDAVVGMASGGRQRFDRGGKMAAKGKLDQRLFRKLQAHPFFARRPPKSTGREEFGMAFARRQLDMVKNRKLKIEDIIHTLARLTAWSIADSYERFLPHMPQEVIVCGGGADNPVLMGMLQEEMEKRGAAVLRRIDEFGIHNKAKEAASFALLGAATLNGVCGNLPGVTGANRAVVLGVVARP